MVVRGNGFDSHREWHIRQPRHVAAQPLRPDRLGFLPQKLPQLTGGMAAVSDAEPLIGSLELWMLGVREVVDAGGIDRRGEPTTHPIQESGFR